MLVFLLHFRTGRFSAHQKAKRQAKRQQKTAKAKRNKDKKKDKQTSKVTDENSSRHMSWSEAVGPTTRLMCVNTGLEFELPTDRIPTAKVLLAPSAISDVLFKS